MSFKISEKTRPGKVVLKVNDLSGMTDFYQNKIGLDILNKTDNSIVLGITADKHELVELVELPEPNPPELKTGLYHMALRVPTRKELGNVFYSLRVTHQIHLQGTSDHGSTEAIYLNDPEGNGIEIYRDKTKEKRQTEKNRLGRTTALDAEAVLAERDKNLAVFRLPQGTDMGHVHLMVDDVSKTEDFYTKVLGFDLKTRAGTMAVFFAAGDYHHHIGANMWSTKYSSFSNEKDLGLVYYSLKLPDKNELNRVKENILQNKYEIFEETNTSFKVDDDNGITVKIESK